jgi:hypothetical protein
MPEPGKSGGRGKIQPRWKKGESGNPKGKPPTPPSMREMAEILPDLPTLFAKVLSEKKGDMTALEAGIRRTVSSWITTGNINAGRLILEYAYGKPKEPMQAVNPEYQPPVINLTINPEIKEKYGNEKPKSGRRKGTA